MLENTLKFIPGFFGVLSKESRYMMVNDVATSWLGFKKPEQVIGLGHDAVNCPAAELAHEWIKQDLLALQGDVSSKSLSYTVTANNIWRLVLGEKRSYYDNTVEDKVVVCHFLEITNLGVIDVFPFLKKKNGFPQKKQVSLTLLKNYYSPSGGLLSVRESECLFFLMRGKTIKEIARLLNISPRTVEQYVNNLKCKFNACSKGDLIYMAIDAGYMNLMPETLYRVAQTYV